MRYMAPDYIRQRRIACHFWVKRNRRSLAMNPYVRIQAAKNHELLAAAKLLANENTQKEAVGVFARLASHGRGQVQRLASLMLRKVQGR
jgi:hypothetical protein